MDTFPQAGAQPGEGETNGVDASTLGLRELLAGAGVAIESQEQTERGFVQQSQAMLQRHFARLQGAEGLGVDVLFKLLIHQRNELVIEATRP